MMRLRVFVRIYNKSLFRRGRVDLAEQLNFVPDFFKVRSIMPHGALVLSPHSMAGRVWLNPHEVVPINEFNIVGAQMQITRAARHGSTDYYG